MLKQWTDDAWDDYVWWQSQDRKTLRRINSLIKDAERDPTDGLGKPEGLSGNLSGMFSRRIDQKNRLIYAVEGGVLYIYSCKDHYDDK